MKKSRSKLKNQKPKATVVDPNTDPAFQVNPDPDTDLVPDLNRYGSRVLMAEN
jgi:hypothetical protein